MNFSPVIDAYFGYAINNIVEFECTVSYSVVVISFAASTA
jgi:hypothetical protein